MTGRRPLLLLLALLAVVLPAAGRERSPRVRPVRVACCPSPGWCDVQADGGRTGLVPEWTAELAKRCGWRVSWVNAVWSSAFEQLERGEIDVLVGVMSSRRRQERVLFPNTPFVLFPYFLFGHVGDARLERGVKGLEGARVGLVRGYWHNEVLRCYLRRKGIESWTPVTFGTELELSRAFLDGEVDAALGDLTAAVKQQNATPVIAFPPIPLFTAVSPHRPELLAEIEYATSSVLMETPMLVHEMHMRNISDALFARPLVDTTTDPDLARAMVEVARKNHAPSPDEQDGASGNARLERIVLGVTIAFSLLSVLGMLLFLRLYRRAEAGRRARANFLALMSHEIRTPLNIVVGFAENLQKAGLPADQVRESARGLWNSAQTLLSLVNDVLMLSKLEAHRMAVLDGCCDCDGVFRDIARMFAPQFREKGVAFTCRAEAVPPLRLRDACLRQILLNLVGNACKFTREGAVSCTATVSEEAPGRVTFVLLVRDTGPGIDPDQLATVFDPFTQAGSAIRDQFAQGTGLGLAIVDRLVRSAGGTVDVRSELGRGTAFVIRIPGLQVCTPLGDVPDGGGVPNAEARALNSVLVVDDVPLNRKILQIHLASLGVSDVRTAADGQEAIAELERRTPDLVLTDVWMPRMDGAELSRRVAARWPELPVVAITADTDAATTFDASHFRALLTKPITEACIRGAVRTCGFTLGAVERE